MPIQSSSIPILGQSVSQRRSRVLQRPCGRGATACRRSDSASISRGLNASSASRTGATRSSILHGPSATTRPKRSSSSAGESSFSLKAVARCGPLVVITSPRLQTLGWSAVGPTNLRGRRRPWRNPLIEVTPKPIIIAMQVDLDRRHPSPPVLPPTIQSIRSRGSYFQPASNTPSSSAMMSARAGRVSLLPCRD